MDNREIAYVVIRLSSSGKPIFDPVGGDLATLHRKPNPTGPERVALAAAKLLTEVSHIESPEP